MKTLSIAICLLLCISFASSFELIAKKFRLRQAQNCLNGQNLTAVSYPGWFWNEQQCMVCMSETCFRCNALQDCIGCMDGYKLEPVQNSQTKRFCTPCGHGTISQCCFQSIDMGEGKGYISDTYSVDRVHATKCKFQVQVPNSASAKLVNRWNIFGHYCVNIPYCDAYTQYGRCLRCFKGYYLTTNQQCTPCNPPMWSDQYVYTIQNEFELAIKITTDANPNTGTPVPSASESLYCEQCFGERQCTICGIYWNHANLGESRGSYLAVNVYRETFDKNVGRNPSFCVPCNPGCQCTGPDDLCSSCLPGPNNEQNLWYKDIKKNRCFRCDARCGQGSDEDEINCCRKCQWDEHVQGPRCLECQTQYMESGHDHYVGVVSFNDWLRPNRTVYSRCYRCDRPNRFAGLNAFELPRWPNGASSSTSSNYGQQITFERLQKDVPSHPNCVICEAKTVYPTAKVTSADGTIRYQPMNDIEWALRYISCTQCENGFEQVFFGGNSQNAEPVTGLKLTTSDNSKLQNLKFPSSQAGTTTDQYEFHYKVEKSECRECQKLIKYQDRNETNPMTENTDEALNRYTLVRRCQQTAVNSNQYIVTQCGTDKEEDYILEGTAAANTNKAQEYSQRGPYLPYQWTANGATQQTQWASVIKEYFNPDSSYVSGGLAKVGVLSYFLVNVGRSTVSRTCIRNKWQCLLIKTQNTFPITDPNEPKCESCFTDYGYILTTIGHCRKCDRNESPEIKIGCSECENDSSQNDTLRCTNCHNNLDGLISNNSGNPVYPLNYYFNSTTRECIQCNVGCKTCVDQQKTCSQCMTNWGKRENSTTDCHNCADEKCINCDNNQKICLRCYPGYRLVSLSGGQTTTINQREVRCEACETGCITCPNDRKTCTECNRNWYYLDNGKCKVRRHGCINWEMNGGRCLKCQYNYRLNPDDGSCYRCFNSETGFIDCPANCGNNYISSNTRFQSTTPVDQLTRNQNSGQTVSSRILDVLDQDEN